MESPSSSNPSCEMIGDLDFDDNACAQTETVYIPYQVGHDGYLEVNGTLTSAASMIDAHEGLSSDECASACTKTLLCTSFVLTDLHQCRLYDSNTFQRDMNGSTTDRLFISVDDLFPLKKYMSIEGSCLPTDDAYESSTTKLIERCQGKVNLFAQYVTTFLLIPNLFLLCRQINVMVTKIAQDTASDPLLT